MTRLRPTTGPATFTVTGERGGGGGREKLKASSGAPQRVEGFCLHPGDHSGHATNEGTTQNGQMTHSSRVRDGDHPSEV